MGFFRSPLLLSKLLLFCTLHNFAIMLNFTTFFYAPSNQAFINSTCLLFGIPLLHAIYLEAKQSTYVQCDIWGDALQCLDSLWMKIP